MLSEILDPKNDFVFKRIFGCEENKDLLLAFLNHTFSKAGEPPLTEIILLNPYTEKVSPSDKQSIFDIQARTDKDTIINVEMQLLNRYDNEKRTLYYWSKQYSAQLEKGNPYKQLKKCVTINILNFTVIANERYHNVFHLCEDHSGLRLSNDIEIHFIELSKIDDTILPVNEGLLSWLLFLKSENKQNWEVLKMKEPILGKAMTELEFLSQDKETRRLYEMRQKALHDEASMLAGAKKEGKLEVATVMLEKGMDIKTISEVTGIEVKELQSLHKKKSK